ncbi:hypothetical protein LCGC14_0146080 [marine sediment metagenome]|uniref:Uncharacterized protein n=1 Tax=marine sediment metagenome TaxID=412755 RepID=A0A0F9VFD0_9ZZZZ
MAYIIGLMTPEEIERMEDKGWEVDDLPPNMLKFFTEDIKEEDKMGMEYKSVFVDGNVDQILGAIHYIKNV